MMKEFAHEARQVHSREDFKRWIRRSIRPRLPHKALFCGLGHGHSTGFAADFGISIDCPSAHLQSVCNTFGTVDSPVLRRWFTTDEAVTYETEEPWGDVPESWRTSFDKHLLRNLIAQGLRDSEAKVASYHCFYGFPDRITAAQVDAVNALVPLLHKVLLRVFDASNAAKSSRLWQAALTVREREIARWAASGKTNGEIADLYEISENTIKHHMTSILAKLEVKTRTQLARRLTAERPVAPAWLLVE